MVAYILCWGPYKTTRSEPGQDWKVAALRMQCCVVSHLRLFYARQNPEKNHSQITVPRTAFSETYRKTRKETVDDRSSICLVFLSSIASHMITHLLGGNSEP